MKIHETKLSEVKVFTPAVYSDARGDFSETYAERRYAEHVAGVSFIQDNESRSAKPFTIRGLHYQAPPCAQGKLIRVVHGKIYDVAVDIRNGSPTYGHWVSEILSANNRRQLFAPAGFLHGFMTLEPDTVVNYKVTDYYNAALDGAVHWASPTLGIPWPASPADIVVSDKDAAAVDFNAFESPFPD